MNFIHVDLDNIWIYEKEFGIKIHPDRELIYRKALPKFLEMLKRYNAKATFMVVGQDLELNACRIFCLKALKDGHEIANHTWSHPISFGKLSYQKKKQQIVKTHDLIYKICKLKPIGFRGSGYYIDNETLSMLFKLGYLYDSSIIPGIAPILMKTYAYIKGGENKHKTFGRFDYLLKPNRSHLLKSADKTLLELPISTFPYFHLPIHTTFAYFFGTNYQKLIVSFLKRNTHNILYLFHAIDFVDLPHNITHPVIPLRYSYDFRMNYAETIIKSLKGNYKKWVTSADYFKANHRQHL